MFFGNGSNFIGSEKNPVLSTDSTQSNTFDRGQALTSNF